MLGMLLIAATMAGADPAPIARPRITEGTGAITAASEPKRERRYCVKMTPTGSRLSRSKCQTRADWIRDGADPELFN